MHSHLTRQQLEALTLRWEQWESEAATRAQKIARARLHLLFLVFRYGGLRLGEALSLEPCRAIDTVTGMMRVSGANAREILLPLSAMRHIRRILSLPQAAKPGFLRFDQGFVRKKFYAVGETMDLPAAIALHVPMPLVQKFLGQQGAAQLRAFLKFSGGEACRLLAGQKAGLESAGHNGPAAAADDGTNLFFGVVSGISSGMRKIQVELTTFSDVRLAALCSPEEAGLLELHENQVLSVHVDPARIVVCAEKMSASLVNRLHGVVESLHADMVETFVCLGLPDGTTLRATLDTRAVGKLHLVEGKKVFAYFPAGAVRLLAD